MKELGAAHIRLFGDRVTAQNLIGVGRKHLGRLKNGMNLAGVYKASRSILTPMGVAYRVTSDMTGTADTDVIEIYVPYGYGKLGGKLWDQCLGFVVKSRLRFDDTDYTANWHILLQAPARDENGDVIETEFYTHLSLLNQDRVAHSWEDPVPGLITSPVQTYDSWFGPEQTYWVYTGTHTETAQWWADIAESPELTFNPKLKDYDLAGYINGAWGTFTWQGYWGEGSLRPGTPKAQIGPYTGDYQPYLGNPCWLKLDPINGLRPDYQSACYNYQESAFAHDFHWASAYRCHLKAGGDAYYIQSMQDQTDESLRVMVENPNTALSVPIDLTGQVLNGEVASEVNDYHMQPCEIFRNDALAISLGNTYEEDGFPKDMEFNCYHKRYTATHIVLPKFKCRFDYPDKRIDYSPYLVDETTGLTFRVNYGFGHMSTFPIADCTEYVYNTFSVNDGEGDIFTKADGPYHKLWYGGHTDKSANGIDVETEVEPGEYFVSVYHDYLFGENEQIVRDNPFSVQFDVYLFGTLYRNYKRIITKYDRDRNTPIFKITVGESIEFDRIDEAPDFIEIIASDNEEA